MADEVRAEWRDVLDTFGRRVQEQPYPMLALGIMAGYVLGGGLFSPLTRPLARAAMGALLVPGFRDHLRDLVADLTPAEATGAA